MAPKSKKSASPVAANLKGAVDILRWRLAESIAESVIAAKHLSQKLGPAYWEEPAYLKKLRDEAGLSQHALARTTGISRSVIANYETGVTTPSIDNAFKICMALEGLGSKEAAKTLVHLATYDKEICLSVLKSIDAELDALKKRREVLQKRVTSIQQFLEFMEKRESKEAANV